MPLPDPSNWSFRKIAAADLERGTRLERCLDARALIVAVTDRLQSAWDKGTIGLGLERACERPAQRSVVQFHVGRDISDWFFNGRAGYRAHFRAGVADGLAFNEQLVEAIRSDLESRLAPVTPGLPDVDCHYALIKRTGVSRADFLQSLDLGLAKVWFCGRHIDTDQIASRDITTSLSGPRLVLSGGEEWSGVEQEDGWLEVKGAFVGHGPPFQPKLPLDRAKDLRDTGRA